MARPLAAFLVLAALAAGSVRAAGAARLSGGLGVTPGGLVWSVGLRSRTLVLRDPLGARHLTLPLRVGEGWILGVDDDGSRVTSRRPDGLARTTEGERVLDLTFRSPDGSVRATREVGRLEGWEGSFLGAAVNVARRDGDRLAVERVTADGETRLAEIPSAPLEAAVGRASLGAIHAGPDGVVVAFSGRGPAYVRLDRPGEPVAPDPDASCGPPRQPRAVVPHRLGLLEVSLLIPPQEGDEIPRPVAVAEVLDRAGRTVRSAALGPFPLALPLPGGGLLLLDGTEAVEVDAGLVAGPPVPFALDPDEDVSVAARRAAAVRRGRGLGPRASGADWAELALLPGDASEELVDVAARDPEGAVGALARVADGTPEAPRALSALHSLTLAVRSRGATEGAAFASLLEEMSIEGAPAWLVRFAGLALLAERKDQAPAWASGAAAEALADRGADDLGAFLPDDAVTLPLAETIAAVDRARMEKLERERPDLAASLGVEQPFPEEDEALAASVRFHVPPDRFPRTLLACTEGPPSLRSRLALLRLSEAIDLAPTPPSGTDDPNGMLAGALLEAQASADPGLRAAGLALGPFVGLPIDPVRYRADVLARGDLAPYVRLGLLADRSLPPRAFSGLFLEALERARRASADPWGCSLARYRSGDEPRDAYCGFVQLAGILASPGSESELLGDRAVPERVELLRAWARSSAAPPEIRLGQALARAVRGQATEDEVLEVWQSPDVPASMRRAALVRRPEGTGARLATLLERELAEGRGAAADRSIRLRALTALAPVQAAALAAAEWKAGRVPLDAGDAVAARWVAALDPSQVEADEALRTALGRAAAIDPFSLDIAWLLARAHLPGSADALAAQLLRACRSCRGARELAEVFGALGPDGVDALARLAASVPRLETEPLEALFELDPDRAAALASERLDDALERGCVPPGLVPLLARQGLDPFPAVGRALEDRHCSRQALEPDSEVSLRGGGDRAEALARGAREALPSAPCRKAFARLFGLDATEREQGGGVTVTVGRSP